MASIMGLHLQYRLWIAEMNADINVLRIFDDYLAEITLRNNTNDIAVRVKDYQEQFLKLRNDIDGLRHEMHLNKMELAAASKKRQSSVKNIEKNIKHKEIKQHYKRFRKTFDKTKKDFHKFESKLMR